MTAANQEILWRMLQAPWAYLESQQEFLDLGLTQFRLYDGRKLPVEEDEETGLQYVALDELPAIKCEVITPASEDQETTPSTDSIVFTLEIDVVYPDTSGDGINSMMDCVAAMETLHALLNSTNAKSTRLGHPEDIDDYKFSLRGTRGIDAESPDSIGYWMGASVLEIQKQRPRIQG